jgi:hypothetical protein
MNNIMHVAANTNYLMSGSHGLAEDASVGNVERCRLECNHLHLFHFRN